MRSLCRGDAIVSDVITCDGSTGSTGIIIDASPGRAGAIESNIATDLII
ncbi:MAG: hypothetical protein H7282_07465 [Cytophagaceae bacterium]|nr:hypothetical protein [Cytophagaceae bacterium]